MLGILFAWCPMAVRGKLLQQKNVNVLPPFVAAELPFFKQTIVDWTTHSYQDDNLAEMLFQEIQTSSSSLLIQDTLFKWTISILYFFLLQNDIWGFLVIRGKKKKNQRMYCFRSAIAIAWSYLSLKWKCIRKATFSFYEGWMTHALFTKENA